MSAPPMKIVRRKVGELLKDPKNRRLHDRRNIESIKESLKEFGQQKPIVVDAKGKVTAGNGTLEAADELGWTEIDTVLTRLRGVKQRRYSAADNRTAELAKWDIEGLVKDHKQPNYKVPGFTDSDIQKMSKKASAAIDKPKQKIHVTMTCPKCDYSWER